MIIVTGGAGFIGSAIVWRLNTLGNNNIIIADDLGSDEKWKNLPSLDFQDFIHKDEFITRLESKPGIGISAIIHMGANSATTEKNADSLITNNFEYTKRLARYCEKNNVRFIYASSAATYGDGSLGFDDNNDMSAKLRPLNMYGYSKNLFDIWAIKQGLINKFAGLKYFNVYGPNEFHKGDMRSVVIKAFEQIRDSGKVKLFKSHRPDYNDGEQKRDFIYIKDAVDMTLFFLNNPDKNGLFNVGTGNARTWNDLVNSIFNAMNIPANIEYIDLPLHLQDKYQYFTEANNYKIINAGYTLPLRSLEEGVTEYVQNYLMKGKYLGMD
jgi:ADP-L-glycero-D-manno-heptose 6-epimerase